MNLEEEIVLSVIIPVYNGDAYIKVLMESIAEQHFEKFEVLMIDDGSTDHTGQLCDDYAGQYSWLHVIHTENCGVSHARNRGLDEAAGKWIQFIDADDRIRPGIFHNFYQVVCKEDTELAVCGCTRYNLNTGSHEDCGPLCEETLRHNKIDRLFDHLPMGDRYWLLDYVWNKWYRREIIESFKIRFDETLSLGEDFVFNTQYMQHISSISLLKTRYYQYLTGENGLAHKFQKEPWNGRNILYEAHKKLYDTLGLWESNKGWIQCQAGQIAFGDIRMINEDNCPYGNRKKLLFIRKMLESDQYPLILMYLREKSSLAFRIYYHVFRAENEYLMLILIRSEKLWKKVIRGKN